MGQVLQDSVHQDFLLKAFLQEDRQASQAEEADHVSSTCHTCGRWVELRTNMLQLAFPLQVSEDHQAAHLVSYSIGYFIPDNLLTHRQLDLELLRDSKVLPVAGEAFHHQVSVEGEQARENGRWIKPRSMHMSVHSRQALVVTSDRQEVADDLQNIDHHAPKQRRVSRKGCVRDEHYLARDHRCRRKLGDFVRQDA